MASVISAGTTSTTALNLSGDTTGVLQLQTNGTTAAMTIDTSQNVGIGTTSVTSGWRFEAKGGLPAIFNADSTASTATYGGVAFYRPTNAGGQGNGIQFALNNSSSTQVEYAYIGGLIETNTAGSQNGAIIFAPTSAGSRTERMRLNSNGNLVLSGGTNNANGIGITFPATQSASTDANTLDDYEEGDFTPTVIGSSTAGTATYGSRFARYTKIGRVVYIEILISWSSGTGSGFLKFGNLPFTCANAVTYPSLSIGYINDVALSSGNIATGFVGSGEAAIYFYQTPTGGGASTTVPYDAAGYIQIAGCYTV